MYSVDLYNRVRRACHIEGMSKSAAARLFGIDRKTVAKILLHALPPGYRRSQPPVRPKLDAFVPIIDQILEEDKTRIKSEAPNATGSRERAERAIPPSAFTPGCAMKRSPIVTRAPTDTCSRRNAKSPMRASRPIWHCGPITVPAPIWAPPEITENGPTETPGPSSAEGEMTALG